VGTANCIGSAAGRTIPQPRISLTQKPSEPPTAFPLSDKAAAVVGALIVNDNASFPTIADAVIELVAHHIRTSSMAQLDPRLADAIEDNLHVDPIEGDVDQAAECSVEDMEAISARRYVKRAMDVIRKCKSITESERSKMVGIMLRKPAETRRYETLREVGHTTASALAIIIHERKVGAGPVPPGACPCCRKKPDAPLLRFYNTGGRVVDGVTFGELCLGCMMDSNRRSAELAKGGAQ
jgi:hypothetical protein